MLRPMSASAAPLCRVGCRCCSSLQFCPSSPLHTVRAEPVEAIPCFPKRRRRGLRQAQPERSGGWRSSSIRRRALPPHRVRRHLLFTASDHPFGPSLPLPIHALNHPPAEAFLSEVEGSVEAFTVGWDANLFTTSNHPFGLSLSRPSPSVFRRSKWASSGSARTGLGIARRSLICLPVLPIP